MKSEINSIILAKIESRLYKNNCGNNVMARGNTGVRARMMTEEAKLGLEPREIDRNSMRRNRLPVLPVNQE